MIKELKSETVICDRGHGAFVATTIGVVYADRIDPKSGQASPEPGAELGILVRGDNHLDVAARRDQLRVPAEGEIEQTRSTETAAAEHLSSMRAQLWGGGGKVVYTQ